MKDTKAKQIRKMNADGVLTEAGFVADEFIVQGSSGNTFAVLLTVVGGICVFFGGMGLLIQKNKAGYDAALIIGILIILVVYIWRRPFPKWRTNTIVFSTDGPVKITKSPRPWSFEAPRFQFADIRTIAPRPIAGGDGSQAKIFDGIYVRPSWEVVAHLHDGQTVALCRPFMMAEDADYVSIQLNLAKKELERAQATQHET